MPPCTANRPAGSGTDVARATPGAPEPNPALPGVFADGYAVLLDPKRTMRRAESVALQDSDLAASGPGTKINPDSLLRPALAVTQPVSCGCHRNGTERTWKGAHARNAAGARGTNCLERLDHRARLVTVDLWVYRRRLYSPYRS